MLGELPILPHYQQDFPLPLLPYGFVLVFLFVSFFGSVDELGASHLLSKHLLLSYSAHYYSLAAQPGSALWSS